MDINPDKCALAQGFGANGNPSYHGEGLAGHTGRDYIRNGDFCGYGSVIHPPYDMYIYKVFTTENPSHDGSGYTAVFGIVDNGIECFEYEIGHCDPLVFAGDFVKAGDPIGTEANHGPVWHNGVQITLAMQAAGNKEGSHRHCQKRPVMKTLRTDPNHKYLSTYSDDPAGAIYRDPSGYYYQIWNYYNGYHGCIDPTISVFQRDLSNGVSGYDVFVLQNILVREGCATFEATGYFGNLTLAAMIKLQAKVGIMPDVGYFGPKTRAILQAKYNV